MDADTTVMTFSIEVLSLPVSDVNRALRFYVDRPGFSLDVDYAPNDAFRVVQITPPGSSCSIQIGKGLTDALTGSFRNTYLVVTDLKRPATACSRVSRSRQSGTRSPSMPRTQGSRRGLIPRAGTTPALKTVQ